MRRNSAILLVACAIALASDQFPARAEDEGATMLCVGTIQKIQGNLWTVPDASSEPICRARILSRQVKGGLLTVCKIGQKCAFSGTIIIPPSQRRHSNEPYWDTIDAKPVH
jgi:hypothetical protein